MRFGGPCKTAARGRSASECARRTSCSLPCSTRSSWGLLVRSSRIHGLSFSRTPLTLLNPSVQFGSRGAKQFVDEMVPALKSEFPHVDLVVEKRSGHPPFLEGFYKNGRRKPIGVKVRIFLRQFRAWMGAGMTTLFARKSGESYYAAAATTF